MILVSVANPDQNMSTPEVLLTIKLELERYQTAYCGLKHEHVVHISSFEGTRCVKRYGLCDRSTRRYRLGCAHTKGNDEFFAGSFGR